MGINYSPKLPKINNLSLYFDTHNPKCFTPSSTTLYDLSGNNNNGNFVSPTFGNDGIMDNMIYYDGTGTIDGATTGSCVSYPYQATTSNPSLVPNGRTLIWIAKPDDTSRRSILFGSGTINHMEQYNGSSFRTEAKLQNGFSFGSSGCSITAGKYDMFTIIFNNDLVNPTVKWYQNGSFFYEKSMINSTPATDYFEPNMIGRSTGSASYTYASSYKGFIPVFISYDTILNEDEINKIYHSFRGRFEL